MINPSLESLQTCFSEMSDPRVVGRTSHSLRDILVLTICAVVAGADDWEYVEMWGTEKIDWLKQYLSLDNGIPSHDTIGRVFSALDSRQFQSCFTEWVATICTRLHGDVIAIDGKTARRSHDRKLGKKALHVVSALLGSHGITLGQLSTDEKSNEITAIPKLIDMIDIEGSIVTIDAMGCQTEIANKIIEKGGDYVLGLKGNQGKLSEQVKDFFDIAEQESYKNVAAFEDISYDKGHGRIETRRCVALSASYFENTEAWRGIQSMVMVESTREIGDKISREKRYYISSITPNANLLASAIRAHWGIENQLHWCLDVTFREDACRVRKDNASENFNIIRKIALNLLKTNATRKLTVAKKRQLATLNNDYLAEVLGMAR